MTEEILCVCSDGLVSYPFKGRSAFYLPRYADRRPVRVVSCSVGRHRSSPGLFLMSSLLIASRMLASLKKKPLVAVACSGEVLGWLALSLLHHTGRDVRRVSSPPNTFLQILVTQLFCLRTRSISLRLLISENQISLRDSRISQNQPDLVLSLVGRSIDRWRGGCLTSLYSPAKHVCFTVCFVVWRNGSLIHGSRGFAETEREWAWSGCSQLILLVAAADVWYSCREREILKWVWSGRCVSLQPILLLVADV
jgi:hypothetical protein